jgi:uncharacterized protein (TIGR03437 family)
VKLLAQAPPAPVLSTVHGIGYTGGPLAPGGFVVLEGTGFAEKELQALAAPYPARLAGVQVSANGWNCRLVSVSPTRVVGILPMALAAAADPVLSVVLTNAAGSTDPFATNWGARPVILTGDREESGPALVLDETLTPLSSVAAGQTIVLPITGLGPTEPAVADGAATPVIDPPPTVLQSVRVFFGDSEAQVVSATLAAGQTAVYHVKVVVPEGGDGSLTVTAANGEFHRANLPGPPRIPNVTDVRASIEPLVLPASLGKVPWSPLFTAARFNVQLTLAPGAQPFLIELKAPAGGITVQVDPGAGTWTASASVPTARTQGGDFRETGITPWNLVTNLPMRGDIVPPALMLYGYTEPFRRLSAPNQPTSDPSLGVGPRFTQGAIPSEGPLVFSSDVFPASSQMGAWVPLSTAPGSRPTGVYTAIYTLVVDGVETAKAAYDYSVQP